MALFLNEQVIGLQEAHTRMTGQETFNVSAGKTLAIETSPAGGEVFSDTVPAGKEWSVTVSLLIIESDV